MIFRLNLKTEESVIFSTPNYTECMFLDLISYVYLKSCTIFNASCDFASEKVFIIKNITSKQTKKNKQTNKQTKKNNEANPEFKADAAVPQYHCQNFLYSVSNLEYNLMSFFYYFSVIIITSYVLTLLKFILLRENCIRCYSYFCLLPP